MIHEKKKEHVDKKKKKEDHKSLIVVSIRNAKREASVKQRLTTVSNKKNERE